MRSTEPTCSSKRRRSGTTAEIIRVRRIDEAHPDPHIPYSVGEQIHKVLENRFREAPKRFTLLAAYSRPEYRHIDPSS
jgi:hypothetical protein